MYGRNDIYGAPGGFGQPGVHCDINAVYGQLEAMYGADAADVAEFGSLSGPSIYGLLQEHYGDLSGLPAEEIYGLFKNLRIKWKKNRIAKLLGKLKTLLSKGKTDKARKRALRLQKVINKLKALEPDYEPSDEAQAWIAFGNGEVNHPDEWNAGGGFTVEGESTGEGSIEDGTGIFDTARAINSSDDGGDTTVVVLPGGGRRRKPPLPPRRKPPLRKPPMGRGRGGMQGRGGMPMRGRMPGRGGMPGRGRGGGGGLKMANRMRYGFTPQDNILTQEELYGAVLGSPSLSAEERYGIDRIDIDDFSEAVQGGAPMSRYDMVQGGDSFGAIKRKELFQGSAAFGGLSRQELFEDSFGAVPGGAQLDAEMIYGAVPGGPQLDAEMNYGGIFRRPTWTRQSLSKQMAAVKTAYDKAKMKGDLAKAQKLQIKLGDLMRAYRDIQALPDIELHPSGAPGVAIPAADTGEMYFEEDLSAFDLD